MLSSGFHWLIGLSKLAALTLQSLDPIPFSGRHAITSTAISIGTLDPRTKRIRSTTDLGCNRFDRSRLALKFAFAIVLEPMAHQLLTVRTSSAQHFR